jgi:hypothetical protein
MQLSFEKNLQAMFLASNIFWILFQQTFESFNGGRLEGSKRNLKF